MLIQQIFLALLVGLATSNPSINSDKLPIILAVLPPVIPPRESPVIQPRDPPVIQPREPPVIQPREPPVIQQREPPVIQPREPPVIQPREPPVIQPREPPVIQPREPPVIQPREPPVIQPRDPPVIQPREPPVIQQREPPVIQPREPPVIQPREPPVIQPREPPVIQPREPPVIQPREPPVIQPREPPVIQPREPPVIQPREPPVIQPREPPVIQPRDPPVIQPREPPVIQPREPPVIQQREPPVIQPREPPVIQPREPPVIQPREPPVIQPREPPVIQLREPPVIHQRDTPVIQPRELPVIQPKQTCSCGIRNTNGATRIVGGTQTRTGELPWRVTVFAYDPRTGRGGVCAGTIISNSWVMTAAHCTMKKGDKINVYVGAQSNPLTVGGGSKITVDRYVPHPSFNGNTMNNDISLLHLTTPLTFKSNVSPACLPWNFANSEFSGAIVLASGWGTTKPVAVNTNNKDTTSRTLLQVILPVLTTAQCQKYLRNSVNTNMLCTYNPGKDTCQGDSGGSIDWENKSRYYSIGIVSYGFGCAQTNYPGVYTKVTKYLSWIKSTTGDTFCQN